MGFQWLSWFEEKQFIYVSRYYLRTEGWVFLVARSLLPRNSLDRSGLLYAMRVPKRNKNDPWIVAVPRTSSTTRMSLKISDHSQNTLEVPLALLTFPIILMPCNDSKSRKRVGFAILDSEHDSESPRSGAGDRKCDPGIKQRQNANITTTNWGFAISDRLPVAMPKNISF